MTSKNNIDSLLNSAKYKFAVSETLTSLLKKTKAADTEATIGSIFENELFYFIKQFFNKDIIFKKEIGSNVLRHRFDGRLDAVANDLIIEYKNNSKLTSDKDKSRAIEQVTNYLMQLYAETSLQYQAILTNGIKIKYFYFQDGVLKHTPFKPIEVDDIDRIVKFLLNVGSKRFVPENIVEDFKLTSANSNSHMLALCLYNFLKHSITSKTFMLFEEWQVLFHLSENDSGQNADIEKRRKKLSSIFNDHIDSNDKEYKALFALQTTYAIIVKLIACKVISKWVFNNDTMYFSDLSTVSHEDLREFLEKLEDGYVFATGGIRNLLEGDFFSWYCAEAQWSKNEASIIVKIIENLEYYSIATFRHGYTTIDIFKDLYMEIMPQEVRHSLGEYFTPSWLADSVVNEAIGLCANEKWVAIDPCCGSGIFVSTLIKKVIGDTDITSLNKNEKEVLLREIISRVKGIDINPLSVLTARVSYLLAVAPIIDESRFDIPIYLGDSANIPNKIELDSTHCYQYTIHTKQGAIDVILPCTFVESETFLETMSLLQSAINAEDSKLLREKILKCIPKKEQNELVVEAIKKLSEQLVRLHVNNWDGIWVRIAANFMLIARINNIDIIVGNPPWVKWEFLPQTYAETIKKLCIERHLFSGQTYMGAISLNICALISNVTSSLWLNEKGVLAFLMPKTLLTQDSYAGFRNFIIDVNSNQKMFLQKIEDWSKSGHPFIDTSELFCTYYYSKKKINYSLGVPVVNVIKKRNTTIQKINSFHSFQQVLDEFNFTQSKAYQLDEKRTGFTIVADNVSGRLEDFIDIIGTCDYKARSGVEFTPAEVYFIEPVQRANQNKAYIFKNAIFKNARYKNLTESNILLETTYIRPVVKSPNIQKFHIQKNNNYCIFPYKKGETVCVESGELSLDCQYLFEYLIKQKKLIQKQSARSLQISKGSDFYALSKVGAYTHAEYSVTFRDNTRLASAVVEPVETPWGEKILPICAKHCPYISMDKKGRFITKEEAHYICGILNTNVVVEYFRDTFSTRSYSIDFNIKLPTYDSDDCIHREISMLAQQCCALHDDTEISKIILKIESLYLSMCKGN